MNIISNLAHTDPPAARVVKSSSKQSPSFPGFVRMFLFNDEPPETTSNSSSLFEHIHFLEADRDQQHSS